MRGEELRKEFMKLFNISKYFAKEEEMALDPVCGMRTLRNEKLQAVVKDETYYFCSENCLKEFIKGPDKFI